MNPHFATAEEAEDAFYEAIGRADLEALMNVWADDEEIVCIHPTGIRLSGSAAIRESWRGIFANNPKLTVTIRRSVLWKGGLMAVHSVFETLYLGEQPTPHGPIVVDWRRTARGYEGTVTHPAACRCETTANFKRIATKVIG